jgi:hypothetical protein
LFRYLLRYSRIFLLKFNCEKDFSLPNGQHKYTFPDGLVFNLYITTGAYTYQGINVDGQTARRIAEIIDCINKPNP